MFRSGSVASFLNVQCFYYYILFEITWGTLDRNPVEPKRDMPVFLNPESKVGLLQQSMKVESRHPVASICFPKVLASHFQFHIGYCLIFSLRIEASLAWPAATPSIDFLCFQDSCRPNSVSKTMRVEKPSSLNWHSIRPTNGSGF